MVDVVVELMAALTSDRWVKAFGSCRGARRPLRTHFGGGDVQVTNRGTHTVEMVTTRCPGTIVMSWQPGRETERTEMLAMATSWYAVRVRGRPADAATAASEEGLEVAIDPVRTVLRGRLPDQAALLGVLTRARLLGLELMEVRRRPRADHRP
jgi:hypothetical protein